uniref:Uncharacterized protein n=1 Tax=Cacopsylla melanoneura TaxID=428564 RepID=A0A8D8ZHA2_9HEMI
MNIEHYNNNIAPLDDLSQYVHLSFVLQCSEFSHDHLISMLDNILESRLFFSLLLKLIYLLQIVLTSGDHFARRHCLIVSNNRVVCTCVVQMSRIPDLTISSFF